jgi:hypothetical protein
LYHVVHSFRGQYIQGRGALPHTPPRGLFEKSPLGTRKNFPTEEKTFVRIRFDTHKGQTII